MKMHVVNLLVRQAAIVLQHVEVGGALGARDALGHG